MNTHISRTGALTPAQREAVLDLVERATTEDRVRPLNEAAGFALDGRGHAVHWLAHCGGVLSGYAQCDRPNHQVQMVVHPELRRRGVATCLAAEVAKVEKQPVWWAFGDLPAARAMAESLGARKVRELLVMERNLAERPLEPTDAPQGVVLRPFSEADASALVEVNAEAFAHHPEQGQMTLADFRLRADEDWFDPQGIIVAADEETGAMLGFHWTKTEHGDTEHPDELLGEVYVIGVSPGASGRGIGRALLNAGMEHLVERGVERVRLYVEASEHRVVKMYESARFVVVTRDASYAS
ncbi:mycothiol synthase [Luteococcus sp.]|uniref:mycothiol synthase n=1 Tax=Luteococcus sp. TaxID=1969402 RepID=UPI003736A7CD